MLYEKDGDWTLEKSPEDLLTGSKPESKPAQAAKSVQALGSKTQTKVGDEDINIEGKEAESKTAVDSAQQQASKTEVVKSEAAISVSKEPSTSQLLLEPEPSAETTNCILFIHSYLKSFNRKSLQYHPLQLIKWPLQHLMLP
jgi:hypothetical protein